MRTITFYLHVNHNAKQTKSQRILVLFIFVYLFLCLFLLFLVFDEGQELYQLFIWLCISIAYKNNFSHST